MKKSIIKDIYYGERGGCETIKESKEYWGFIEQAAKISGELTETLTEKQKELFKKLELAEMEIESETAVAHFAEGFKIGLLIGIECVED